MTQNVFNGQRFPHALIEGRSDEEVKWFVEYSNYQSTQRYREWMVAVLDRLLTESLNLTDSERLYELPDRGEVLIAESQYRRALRDVRALLSVEKVNLPQRTGRVKRGINRSTDDGRKDQDQGSAQE